MSGSSDATLPRRKKKACQRCRHRKQRCDFEQPCHNCQAAGVDCLPVVQESFQNYPAGYVPALESHAAMLERIINEQVPGTAPDHLDSVRTQYLGGGSAAGPSHNSQNYTPRQLDFNTGTSPDADSIWNWQPPTPNAAGTGQAYFQTGAQGQNNSSPDLAVQASPTPPRSLPRLSGQITESRPEGMEDIPTAAAASFFRTYFQSIHPQYPFLSVRECGDWYTEWKMAPANAPISGWPAFFVKMIFAIGSLIQSKSDNAPRYQHQDLKSQAQSEDVIIRSTKSSPLVRLQAMLLSAMHAIHSESTARISHISGAIIRFASLHGFHRLVDMRDEESQMKTKVWSCAYILDRAISGSLDVPVSLSDTFISSALYVERPEAPAPMPWLDDLPPSDIPQSPPTLGTFAHICKIRLIQSYILNTMQAVPFEGSEATPEWQESMKMQIDQWAGDIHSHSLVHNEGYQSPLWLFLISQLSLILLYRPSRLNITTNISSIALTASISACTTFRALQKKRQIAQPWLVVITQFQAGVTILYIIWARGISVPREADRAIRDCTSVLAILADRWCNAEHYRDCFEVLAREVPQLGGSPLESEARVELGELVEKVEEVGCHRHVCRMLREMAEGDGQEMEI